MTYYFFESNYVVEYGFSLVILNIFVYLFLITSIFSVFFFFKINLIQTLGDLRLLNTYKFFLITIILTLLSLAGVPPLLGFVGKFLLIMTLLGTNNYLFFIYLTLLNLFMLYFYLQNIRFIISKDKAYLLNTYKSYPGIDFVSINTVCFVNSINFFGIFIFEDMYTVVCSLLL